MISKEEMMRIDAVTIEIVFENQMAKVANKNEKSAIVSREKLIVTQLRHSVAKVIEK
jgi:hypothetical protein